MYSFVIFGYIPINLVYTTLVMCDCVCVCMCADMWSIDFQITLLAALNCTLTYKHVHGIARIGTHTFIAKPHISYFHAYPSGEHDDDDDKQKFGMLNILTVSLLFSLIFQYVCVCTGRDFLS